jgi:heme exporter protein CcmD
MSHGFYVGVAYGLVLLVMGVEVLILLRRRRLLRQRKPFERETRP